jgi:hypothetical protein
MALDINDTIENDGSYKSTHMVFKEGVKVKFPDKNADVIFGILPALADPDDRASYLPYRDESTEKFTKWATPAFYYPFVNRERSILSPTTLDSNAFDPIAELIKVAKAHPDYRVLAGFGADGKRLTDAFKNPECKLPSKTLIFAVNGIVLYNRDVPSDEVYIMQLPSTAFKGQGGDADKKSTWGLVSQLNLRNRGSSDDDDFDSKYYWGDITNPHKLVPVKLAQEKPPTGSSFKIYNITPQDEDPVKVGKSVLEKRYDLDNVFYDIEEGEILEYLVFAFGNVPQLLKLAFSSRVPGFDKMLKAATAKRSFASEEQEEEEPSVDASRPTRGPIEEATADDFAPVQRKRKAVSEVGDEETPISAARSFAPKVEPEGDEEEQEEAPAPAKKKTKASSLRNLVED